ncbi:MAG: cyclic peptide export ABC transporter [Bacteroidia bacterium]|nr:cyclic peptide export ABC transporter [Bacteroidia bacterium]
MKIDPEIIAKEAERSFNFFKLLRQESGNSVRKLMIYGVISGVANAILLAIINAAADSVGFEQVNLRYLGMFIVSMALFYLTKNFILRRSTILVEETVARIRTRVLDKIRQSELLQIDQIGKSEIYARLTQDANLISQTAGIIISSFQGGIMVVCCIIYIGFISLPAFITAVLTLTFGVIIYVMRQRNLDKDVKKALDNETRFLDGLTHTLEGFKEIRLNRKKNDELFGKVKETIEEGQEVRTRYSLAYVLNFMFSQTIFYFFIALVIFILPVYFDAFPEKIVHITAAVLFIAGPLETLVGSIPFFTKANVAVDNILQLEQNIQVTSTFPVSEIMRKLPDSFSKIEARGVSFSFYDEENQKTFTSGPIDFSLQKGELVFIVGGNGSGKSTFLKLLTGLYRPQEGAVYLDGFAVGSLEIHAYRELFSTVFTDFHLFDELYGLRDVPEDRVRELIREMGLEGKTDFRNGKFTRLNLSTGQKKRLGLIVAMLEDKPVFVFDEIAADQDPEFRQKFYDEFLDRFRKEGKTIVMVSHDAYQVQKKAAHDKIRVLRMQDGKFAESEI